MAFPDERDRRLIRQGERVVALAGDLEGWLAEHLTARRASGVGVLSGEDEAELLRLRQAAGDLARSSRVPAAAAVFGPSQVGKSLFVGRVLRASDPRFSPLGRDERLGPPGYYQGLDFVADLNPQLGEREATALVTRFTTGDRIGPGLLPEFPVFVKALTRGEWLQILARGFKAECRRGEGAVPWEPASLRSAFEDARRSAGDAPPDPAWRADLYDTYAAMRRHDPREFAATEVEFNGLLGTFRLGARASGALAARVFWGGWPELTAMFDEVAGLLDAIGQAGRGGLLSHWAGVRFLLDSQLSGFHENPGSACFPRVEWSDLRLDRDPRSGWFVLDHRPGAGGNVPAHRLQAAMLELVIPVLPDRLNEDWRETLREIDLLDIPGMRAEKSVEEGKRTSASRVEELMEIVKRGKVLYLFERYVREMQVQTLLILVRHGNVEVKDQLKHHVNLWGRSRFGKAWPRGVEEDPPPLFLGLTGIDAEFRNAKAPPSHLLYENRIATLVDALGPALMEDFGGRRFANVYPIRYPGTWDTDAEERRRSGDGARWEQAGRAFLGSEAVRAHVGSPEERWRAAMDDRDGGASLIAAGFLACTGPADKQDYLKAAMDEAGRRLLELARGWVVDESSAADRGRRRALAGRVLDWLRADADLAHDRVLALKESLGLKEADIWALVDDHESPSDRPRAINVPLARRFPEQLRGFLAAWASGQAPRRWAEFTATNEAGRPWLDAETFLGLAGSLAAYLATPPVFDALAARLLPVVTLRLNDEGAGRHARWKYARMVLNDFLLNPGPDAAPLEEPATDDRDFGLMAPFVRRWAGRLPACLAAGGGGAAEVPLGNSELIALLARHGQPPAAGAP